jgi:hypothetical protein
VRVTVFDVIGMPGTVGVLSESGEVPVAVAELDVARDARRVDVAEGEGPTIALAGTGTMPVLTATPFISSGVVTTVVGAKPKPLVLTASPSAGWFAEASTWRLARA